MAGAFVSRNHIAKTLIFPCQDARRVVAPLRRAMGKDADIH